MAKDYDQMEFDVTLESERSLKDNVQKVIKFALEQIMEYDHPEQVRNRHEGYGIAAECYSSLQGRVKAANGEGDILNVVGSLYNSAAEIAVEAIKLAAQSQRILDDLYYGESKTPIEEYIEGQEAAEDGFEETETAEAEEE